MIDGGLRKIFRAYIPDFDWQSIESGLTGSGIPDANFCCAGIEGWIEFKKTATNAVGIDPAQVGWLERRTRAGGRTFIAVRLRHLGGPRKGAKEDRLILHKGSQARALLTRGLDRTMPLGSWPGGPGSWPWDQVRALILAKL